MKKQPEKSNKTSIKIKTIAAIWASILLIRYINKFHWVGSTYAPNYLLAISAYFYFIWWLIWREVDFELEWDRISKLKDSIYWLIWIIIIIIWFIFSITWTKLSCHETALNNQTTPTYCLFVWESHK